MENTNNKSFLGIGLGLVALAVAAAALFVGINLLSKHKQSETGLNAKSDRAMAVAVESKASLAQIDELKAEVEKLKKSLEANKTESASGIQKVVGQVNTNTASIKNLKGASDYYSPLVTENRNLILANQNAINELATRSVQAPKAAASVVSSSESEVAASEVVEGDYIIYTIKSGDYFSKLAVQFKVSVEAIEDANPNVNPTKLQIGQKINIPVAQ